MLPFFLKNHLIFSPLSTFDSGLSTHSFYRLWNSFYDESPMEMLQARRMFAAEQLLTSTNMRIQESADLCGFSSPVYFYQQFLKMHGCSPAEYRKRRLNIAAAEDVSGTEPWDRQGKV